MSLVAPTDPNDVAGRLNYACQLGHTSFVEAVVRECNVTNFDMLDHYGSPPMYNAALKNDNAALVEYLVKKGASVHTKNEDNETALFIAAFNNHVEVAKALIAHGAKVDEKGGVYGDYPLHCAVRNNLRTMVNLLLQSNAAINCRNEKNETPLYIAASLDRKDILYTLLMNKANKNLQSSDGKDPLFIASEKKHRDCVNLLKANGPAELMAVKQQFEKKGKQPQKKTSWREAEFKRELEELGISEQDAERKPRPEPTPPPKPVAPVEAVKKVKAARAKSGPLPLYDSDEDEEERLARLDQQQKASEKILSALPRYTDPEGTSYNPADPFHEGEMKKAKKGWDQAVPYSKSVGPTSPPKMAFEDHTGNAPRAKPAAYSAPPASTDRAARGATTAGGPAARSASKGGRTTPSKARSSSSQRRAAPPVVKASKK
eukprot:TRINITY_DN22839_c0_g1_i1.p1 TRINITY_DN22839_c0_g1~~TRINITY_DN22839_c0_g1_i1.p1  ORF type:complete len:431 (+),score=184.29 TRINITY_DN22839_c0_g1_i1:67-1359(+)